MRGVTLIYSTVLHISLMSGHNRSQVDFHICLWINVLQYVLLVEVFKENPDSLRYVAGNTRSILTDFRKLWLFLLICTPKFDNWSSIKTSLQCAVWNQVSECCYTPLHWMVYFALWLLFYSWMIFYIGLVKITGSLSYGVLSNIKIFD